MGRRKKNTLIEPVPLTPFEFARLSKEDISDMIEWVEAGTVSSVETAGERYIPFQELRRFVDERLGREEANRIELAIALKDGRAEDLGEDENGQRQFRLTLGVRREVRAI